jgi:hypothetical protein
MNYENTILSELQHVAPELMAINKRGPYTLPEGYFEGLNQAILAQVKLFNLLSTEKQLPYKAPNGYFDQLPITISDRIKQQMVPLNEVQEELASIAPLLNNISKSPVYTLPPTYFETNEQLLVKHEVKAKIIHFGNWKKITQYAVAAVLISVLAVGGIKYIVNTSSFNFDKAISKATDDDLYQVLETNTSQAVAVSTNTSEEEDEGSLFDKVPEDELQQYLHEQTQTAEKLQKNI